MKKVILLFCIFFFTSGAWCQSFHTVISKEQCYLTGIANTTDNGVILCGRLDVGARENPYVIKLNSFGTIEWTSILSNSDFKTPEGIIQTREGGYLLYGEHLIKLDSAGRVEWYRMEYEEVNGKTIQTRDGGYAVIGTFDHSTYGSIARLLKLDSSGNLEWQLGIKDTFPWYASEGIDIIESQNGYFIAGGLGSASNPFLANISNSGEIIWLRTMSQDTKGQQAIDRMLWPRLSQTPDNGMLISATRSNIGNDSPEDVVFLKTNSNGFIEWATMVDAFAIEKSFGILQTPLGDFMMYGRMDDARVGLIFVTVSATGDLREAKTLLIPDGDIFNPKCVVRPSDGSIIVAGTLRADSKSGVASIFVSTLDENICGIKQILVQVTSLRILIDSVYATHATTISKSSSTLFDIISGGTQTDFCSYISVPDQPAITSPLASLFPNPIHANQNLSINLLGNIPSNSYLLSLRDALGKEVYHEKKYITGSEETITIQVSDLPSGIYTVELLDANTFASVWHGKVVKVN